MGLFDALLGKKRTPPGLKTNVPVPPTSTALEETDCPRREIIDETKFPPTPSFSVGKDGSISAGRGPIDKRRSIRSAVESLPRAMAERAYAFLQPEPENPHDSNAIAVYVDDMPRFTRRDPRGSRTSRSAGGG